MARQPLRHARAIHEVHPLTGASIEVFFSDRTLETFVDGLPTGPFSSSYAAYRHAMNG